MWPVVSEAQRRYEKGSPTLEKNGGKRAVGELLFVKLLLGSSLILSLGRFSLCWVGYMRFPASR
jgi:hypothetical protein